MTEVLFSDATNNYSYSDSSSAPSASQASIYMKSPGTVRLALLNISGQVVQELCDEKNVNGSLIYNMNQITGLNSGVYFVRFETEAGTAVKRAVIL